MRVMTASRKARPSGSAAKAARAASDRSARCCGSLADSQAAASAGHSNRPVEATGIVQPPEAATQDSVLAERAAIKGSPSAAAIGQTLGTDGAHDGVISTSSDRSAHGH